MHPGRLRGPDAVAHKKLDRCDYRTSAVEQQDVRSKPIVTCFDLSSPHFLWQRKRVLSAARGARKVEYRAGASPHEPVVNGLSQKVLRGPVLGRFAGTVGTRHVREVSDADGTCMKGNGCSALRVRAAIGPTRSIGRGKEAPRVVERVRDSNRPRRRTHHGATTSRGGVVSSHRIEGSSSTFRPADRSTDDTMGVPLIPSTELLPSGRRDPNGS